jgi:hypothetical protein
MRTGLRFSRRHIVLAFIAFPIAYQLVFAQDVSSCGNADWFAVQQPKSKARSYHRYARAS